MCKVNKNATFKKIFEPLKSDSSLAYSSLPEKTTAQKIYKLRMLNGYTQREFANVCSIGYSSLCKYEIGFKPNNENFKKICESFNIDAEHF
ncbi:MAG: helix-turn-helix domain-containing protein [Clostridium sp.]|uniref:helix-turn-helix domain-containing protein n=1 Tax=Clostridium sp. TaxID=1506 RepID=UPI003D6C9812